LANEAASARPPGYHLLGEIARGGMGAVLRAFDPVLGRELALKVLLEKHRHDPELVRRFLEEARTHGQLQHPGVAPLHEVGRLPDGRPFFAMKLVEGRTLDQLLEGRRGPAEDLPRFLKVFEQVCQAVAYAHSKGVIHRDLKPANVMVGAFGEVQVLDWGVARRLRPGPSAAALPDAATWFEAPPAGPAPSEGAPTAIIAPHPSRPGPETPARVAAATAAHGEGPDRLTRAGTAIGTPAYMAPEQARGETEDLDERCDVFGLGALLCEILTGKPPYRSAEYRTPLSQAQGGDLAEAFARLGRCGADADLIDLARACLAPARDGRPPDAGAVAAALTAHLDSVEARLRQAELEQAAAGARAAEERKRRRLTAALAAALLALTLGGAAAGLWYSRGQAEREARRRHLGRDVTAALDEAERLHDELAGKLSDPARVHVLLSDIDGWQRQVEATRAAWEKARAVADGGPDLLGEDLAGRLARLQGQAEASARHYQLARQLDDARLRAASLEEGKFDHAAAAGRYESLFQAAGLDLRGEGPDHIAAFIRQSPLRYALVAALDDWASYLRSEEALVPRLLAAARLADPDPWRDRVRDLRAWGDRAALERLAGQADVAAQSPQVLLLLAYRLEQAQGDSAGLLRRALLQYPQDFWLLFSLANDLGRVAETAGEHRGLFQAALAVRPATSIVHTNLGAALLRNKDYAGAVGHFRKALELDPRDASAHNNWGTALYERSDLAGAVAHYREALAIRPEHAAAHHNLGNALFRQKDLDGAARHLAEAVRLFPGWAEAHYDLGIVLKARQDLDGAARHCRQALALKPDFPQAHHNLGNTLYLQGDFDGAVAHHRRSVALQPDSGQARGALAQALVRQGNFAEAEQALLALLRTQPAGGPLHRQGQLLLVECRRLAALERKLAAVVKGEARPADAAEQLALADLCHHYKKDAAAAVPFYAAAFAGRPALAEDLGLGFRYAAARAAARAAAGGDKAPPAGRARLRRQALGWLRADLRLWARRLDGGPEGRAAVRGKVGAWLREADLAGVRRPEALAELPPDERAAWRQFWADVEGLLGRAEDKPVGKSL
jgi:serine/threonine-protein kinase